MTVDIKSEAFRNMKWSGASSTYVSIVQLLNMLILAMILDPDQIGIMAALLLVIWFTQYIADGGMSPAIIHREKNTPDILNSLFYINIGIAILLYFVVVATGGMISLAFDEPSLTDYLPISTLSMIIASIGNQFRVILMKELKFDQLARQEMVGMTINSIVSITLALNGFGVWSMIIGHLSGTLIGNFLLISSGCRYWSPGLRCTLVGIQDYARFGAFQLGERISLFLNTRIDQILIGTLIGTQALGIYTIAHNLVITPATRVNQVISQVMFPVFARLQHDEDILRNGYLKLVRLVSLINTPIMIGLLITAPLFVPLLLDDKWHSSVQIIQILAIYALIRATGSPAGSLQMAKGRADLGFKWNLSLMVISVPVLYFGAKTGELTGVALALVAMHAFLFVPYWSIMIKPMIGPPARDYFRGIFKALTPGLLMGLIMFPALYISDEESWITLLMVVSAGVFIFFILTRYVERSLFDEVSEYIKGKTDREQKVV